MESPFCSLETQGVGSDSKCGHRSAMHSAHSAAIIVSRPWLLAPRLRPVLVAHGVSKNAPGPGGSAAAAACKSAQQLWSGSTRTDLEPVERGQLAVSRALGDHSLKSVGPDQDGTQKEGAAEPAISSYHFLLGTPSRQHLPIAAHVPLASLADACQAGLASFQQSADLQPVYSEQRSACQDDPVFTASAFLLPASQAGASTTFVAVFTWTLSSGRHLNGLRIIEGPDPLEQDADVVLGDLKIPKLSQGRRRPPSFDERRHGVAGPRAGARTRPRQDYLPVSFLNVGLQNDGLSEEKIQKTGYQAGDESTSQQGEFEEENTSSVSVEVDPSQPLGLSNRLPGAVL
ncbi:unnamed protein product [Symbiodinium sp. KB8]|nr:unnamed protein product [Symbiodinium sp. KB8]